MKKLVSVFCILMLSCSILHTKPEAVNAAVKASDLTPTVTEYPSTKLEVIPGMEGVIIDSYANNGDYILAFGQDNNNQYLYVLDQGKLIKKYTLEELLKKTTLKDDLRPYLIRVQFINKKFYVMLSGAEYVQGESKYNYAHCQALITKDGLKFTKQNMPTCKFLKEMEYYPCGMISQMGDNYIYTPGGNILPDSTGKMTYYTSKNLKSWTKQITIKPSVPTTDIYKNNDIVWSIDAVTDKGVYFQASSECWFGATEHSYVETYYTSDFKNYIKASGFTQKEDSIINLLELPTYSTNAVAAMHRTVDRGSFDQEALCTLLIATSPGKFKEKFQFAATNGIYNWIYGDNKMFVITASSEGNDYIYQSTDKGKNFTQYKLDGLSVDLFYVNKLLFSTDEGAYIAYGDYSIVGSKDGFLTIKKIDIGGEILGTMTTGTANYIITEAGVCRLTDKELDGLFQ